MQEIDVIEQELRGKYRERIAFTDYENQLDPKNNKP